jgi:uncharacterized RDD family membrane protein YckC
LVVDPQHILAAPLGQHLVVGTWTSDGHVRLGNLGLAESIVELAEVRVDRDSQTGPAPGTRTPPWLVAALTAAIMLMLLWRRQSSLLKPADLPAHLACAPAWKRLAAFLVDAAPALVVTAPLWYAMVGPLTSQDQAPLLEPIDQAALVAKGWTAWALFRCAHGLYCMVTELTLGTSPGKRLLRCSVLTEDGQRPGTRQIILRNVIRIIELELEPPLIPLLLLVVLTRNRQRLGDIIARTVVAEQRAVGQARPVE